MDTVEGLVSPVFVGRADELGQLRALVDHTVDGTSGLMVISGEAGVGKSRLVSRAVEYAAARGLSIMLGHCVQLGTEGLPYAPLVEALRDLVRAGDGDLHAVRGPTRDLVLRLTGAESGTAAPMSGSQVLELVLGLFERLSSLRPLLLVLEDLHWSDRSTLELAAFLARNLRGVPASLLFTYRSDEVDRRHPLRLLQADWERARTGTRVELRRFSRDEVRQQLTGILGEVPEPATLELVYQRSDGNAFLVEEMLSAVRAGDPRGLPPSLKDVLLARLDRLSPAAEEVLRMAAVAGRCVPERLLVAVSGGEDGPVLAAIREAVDAHLLVVDPTDRGYRFRHTLTRDALYDDLLPGERVRLHSRYAEVLDADPGLLADTSLSAAGSMAHHAYASLDLPRALDASIVAGREATERLAPHEALAHFERALQIWPRVAPEQRGGGGTDLADVYHLAGVAAYAAGDVDRARSLLQQALAELPDDTPPERRAQVAVDHARALFSLGRLQAAADLLRATLGVLPPEPTTGRAALEAQLATILMRQFAQEESGTYAALAAETARTAGSLQIEADALITLGVDLELSGDPSGIDQLREGIARAYESGDAYTILRGLNNLSDLLESYGRSAEAVQVGREGLEVAQRSGMLRTIGSYVAGNLAESLLRLGEWQQVGELLDEILDRLPEGMFEATAQVVRAELAMLAGEPDRSRQALLRTRALLVDPDEAQFTLPVATIAAELDREGRDFGRARETVLAALQRIADDDDPGRLRYIWPLLWVGLRAEAERVRIDGGEVEPALAEMAATTAAPTPPTAGYRALSSAELVNGPGSWEAAVAAWRAVGWPWQLAYALLRLAESRAEGGDVPAAQEPLAEAAAIADRLGARTLLVRVRQLARRARIDIGTSAAVEATAADPLVRYALTAREREVLLLVAAGRSNPEIAGELFISPKTAGVHVSNILGKLGVESRVQAAGVVHRLGLGGDQPA